MVSSDSSVCQSTGLKGPVEIWRWKKSSALWAWKGKSIKQKWNKAPWQKSNGQHIYPNCYDIYGKWAGNMKDLGKPEIQDVSTALK